MKIIKPKKLEFDEKQFEDINNNLACELAEKYNSMFKEVLEQDECDIEGLFLGFVDIYYFLSKIIPKDFTVIDFGCAYAPQAYYFRNHKAYIGINNSIKKRFTFKNTTHINGKIEDNLDFEDKKTFAICSYVPTSTNEIRKRFKNLFVYYPE